MYKHCLWIAAVMALAFPVAGADFRVIANPSVPTSTLTKAALSGMFLKKTTHWDNGAAVVPVDQGDRSAVRESFSSQVLGRNVGAVRSFWQQQIFSGRGVPPPEKATEDDLIAFVRVTPGAIGYVSESAAIAGVKVIEVR